MINPKEVRPGNWVIKTTGMDVNHHPFFAYKAVAIDEYFYTFIKTCFPIPLSTAIFGKCGFKHDFGDWYMNIDADGIDDGLPFLRYRLEAKCWYLRTEKIPVQPVYLHQLQNLFYALTYKELNVQLGFFENLTTVGPVNFYHGHQQKVRSSNPLL
jgi:hypothetical protein